MTREQEKDMARDLPTINLRNVILDTVEAHRRGVSFDPTFIEKCRDQLTGIYEDITRGKAA